MYNLNDKEKEFLDEHIDLFEKYDIDEAMYKFASAYEKKANNDDDFYSWTTLEDMVEFLAEDSNMFDNLSDRTCRKIVDQFLDENVISISDTYHAKRLFNPYIKKFNFIIEDKGLSEVNCPNVTSVYGDYNVFSNDVNNPICVLKFPKLKDGQIIASLCSATDDGCWPEGLYLETNAKAAQDIMGLLEDWSWSKGGLTKAKSHIKEI